MHRLVPDFILEQYAAGRMSGSFAAASLFADISGFSAITDTLMAHGQHGSEVLATVMRAIFGPLIQSVYEQDGFIVTFAGDAFTALFSLDGSPFDGAPGAGQRRALAAAWHIQERMAALTEQPTSYGTFSLAAKVGVAVGDVGWGIVSSDDGERAAYYFQGPAVDGCAAAEHVTQPGEVILTPDVYDMVHELVVVEPASEHYRLTGIRAPLPAPLPVEPPAVDPDMVDRFYPHGLATRPYSGEFRHAISLFVSLPTVRTETQLAIFMRSVFALLDRYGGLLNRLDFGDKGSNLLLFWGAPVAYENDVERALNFILDLQTQTSIPINAGVTYRIAHAGFIGSPLREEYTCFGRGVNLAARFMTTAPRGEIWLDEATARRAGSRFEVEFEREMAFKGFAKTQRVYVLYERKEKVEAAFEGKLAGREAELAQLVEFVAPLWEGRYAGALVVWGEPGIGKSRLVHEFRASQVLASNDVLWAVCQADEILRKSLNPFRYWLRGYFGQTEQQSDARNKRNFNRKLDGLLAATEDAHLAAELDRTRSCLGALVNLHWPDSLYEQLDAQGRYENTFVALSVLMQAESQQQPLLLIVEDAHWLDDDSRAFLSRLADRLEADRGDERYPIAVLATARFEGGGLPLGEALSGVEINLGGLSRRALADLAFGQLDGPAAPPLLDLLEERAEGNPFFAEQMLHYLQDQDLLVRADDGWQAREFINRSPLPGDVRVVLVARLDRLVDDVKEAVQTAAVLGREFEVRLLARMLESAEYNSAELYSGEVYSGEDTSAEVSSGDVSRLVAEAEQQAIWSALSELRYVFKHALLRDAAYQMQVRARRQALHALAVDVLESVYAADLSPHYAELAYHAEQARLTDKAVRYLQQAGDAAAHNYANTEAIDYYDRALAIGGRDRLSGERLIQLYQRRGRALELNNRYDEALINYEEMAKLAAERGDKALRLASLMARVTLHATYTLIYNPARAQALAEQALTLAHDLGDQAAEARILWNLLLVHRAANNMSKAIECGERSLALARTLDLHEQMAFVLNDLGSQCYYINGSFNPAKTVLHEASGLWRELDNLPMLANSLASLCAVCVYTGEYDQALTLSEEAFQINQSISNVWGQSHSRYKVGYAYWDRGQPDRAITVMEECIRLSERAGFIVPQIVTRADLAAVYGSLGAIERGLETAYLALRIVETQVPLVQVYVLAVLAHIHLLKGNLLEAESTVDQGKNQPNLEAIPTFSVPVRLVEGELALRQGDNERALTVTDVLLGDLRQFGMRAYIPQVLYLQGQALLGLGQDDAARNLWLKAHTEAEAIGSRRMLWQILVALSQLETDPSEVERLHQQAREIVEYIAHHTGTPELRTSFLALPEVQALRGR